MRASDFDLSKEIQFSLESGITTFKDSRLIIFDANAIGLLRQSLIEELGFNKARRFFLRFGYQNGFSDFMQMKINFSFENEIELLASGPTLHTWEGIVQATPIELKFDRDSGEFLFKGIWRNSYEAEQHLTFNDISEQPVCWSLMGYASGWCTAFFGKPLVAIEPVCAGKGDNHCEWEIKPPKKWGDEAAPYIEALQSFWKESDHG